MAKNADSAGGDLVDDLASLRQDVAHMAETMSHLVQHQTRAAGTRASAAVRGAGDRIAVTAADAQSRARALGGDIEANIVGHPYTSLLIAFGVGIALGMLSRGASDRA